MCLGQVASPRQQVHWAQQVLVHIGAVFPSCSSKREVWDVWPGAHVLGLVQRRWHSEPCLHVVHTVIEPWLFGD